MWNGFDWNNGDVCFRLDDTTSWPSAVSITSVAVRGLIALFAVGSLIDAPTVLGLDRPALARLRGSNPILILFGLPGIPGLPIVSARILSVTADNTAISVSMATAKCGR